MFRTTLIATAVRAAIKLTPSKDQVMFEKTLMKILGAHNE